MKNNVLLLLLAGLLSSTSALSQSDAPAEEQNSADPTAANIFYYVLDPDIITNYISGDKNLGYIRITIQLMADNDANLKLIEQHEPLIRDAIIRQLGSKSAEQITSIANRESLRKELEENVNALLLEEGGSKAVRELIFTKYLYQ